jgi:hypothetical protein
MGICCTKPASFSYCAFIIKPNCHCLLHMLRASFFLIVIDICVYIYKDKYQVCDVSSFSAVDRSKGFCFKFSDFSWKWQFSLNFDKFYKKKNFQHLPGFSFLWVGPEFWLEKAALGHISTRCYTVVKFSFLHISPCSLDFSAAVVFIFSVTD